MKRQLAILTTSLVLGSSLAAFACVTAHPAKKSPGNVCQSSQLPVSCTDDTATAPSCPGSTSGASSCGTSQMALTTFAPKDPSYWLLGWHGGDCDGGCVQQGVTDVPDVTADGTCGS